MLISENNNSRAGGSIPPTLHHFLEQLHPANFKFLSVIFIHTLVFHITEKLDRIRHMPPSAFFLLYVITWLIQ